MNKTAIVTGASQGIEYAIAAYLAEQGFELLLISRSMEKLIRAATNITDTFPHAKTPTLAALDVHLKHLYQKLLLNHAPCFPS